MTSLLHLEKVTLQFPSIETPLIKSFSLSIEPGDFVILLGSNGSGKSSLLKLMNGTYRPSAGRVLFDGKNLQNFPSLEKSQKIVTFTQNLEDSLLFEGTLLENCLLWESRFHSSLKSLSFKSQKEFYASYLKEYHPKFPRLLDQPVRTLSGGEKQALLLGLCLRHPPTLLLMDEHMSALDPKTTLKMIEMTSSFIEKFQVSTVMALHSLEKALLFGNRLVAIKEGKILLDVRGKEKDTLTRENLLSLYD